MRIDTGSQTYSMKVNEWLDRSDSPEMLSMNQDLPFLALSIRSNITMSKLAQKTLDDAAIKIREMNHTDYPHTMERSERDVLHELSQSVTFGGHVASSMLIMNCDYSERPNFAKKRYFTLMTLFGLGSLYRNSLRRRLHETNFYVEKHVESIDRF